NVLSLDSTWTFDDVRFTEEEYVDFFDQYTKAFFINMDDLDKLCLCDYLRNATARHPGLITFILQRIWWKFRAERSPSFDTSFQFLISEQFQLAISKVRNHINFSNAPHLFSPIENNC